MHTIATIGTIEESIEYTDRPTVKVIIKKGNSVLLLNNGLLPGGGVDTGESIDDAINRELDEELGVTVVNTVSLGTVIQYRNFLRKRYVIHGCLATLASTGGSTKPQDSGEAEFVQRWVTIDDALKLVSVSIGSIEKGPMDDDAYQGRLYNLMTTYELLKQVRK